MIKLFCLTCWFFLDLINAQLLNNSFEIFPAFLNNAYIIDKSLYNINISEFIHNCYITIAKDFYQYPDLLYLNNKPLDIKRNQRESILLIKEGIMKIES